tara:strand:+ start:60 stop:470 length:411 start_codon:yes stop_codon:yes gene_type:complete
MRLMRPEDKPSSPCSKSDLIKGIWESPKYRAIDLKALERSTRSHLIELAADLGILLDLEERVLIMRILDGAGIKYDLQEETYDLVVRAVDHALAIYGVADLEALGKNRKTSRFTKGIDPQFLEEVKAKYREKCQMD